MRQIKFKLAIYFRSSIKNINNQWLWKTNVLLNLINYQTDIDKIFLYGKDLYVAKYQLLIKKRENLGLKHNSDPKAFLFNIQMICRISIKLLYIAAQEKSIKSWIT